MSLLSCITGPTGLKGLSTATLAVLVQEIRAFLIDKVAGTAVLERLASTHRGETAPKEV